MQCVEFEDRLNRLLDHRLTPDDDDQLAEHASDCESCATTLQAQQSLFLGLRAGAPQLSRDLAGRIVGQRCQELAGRRGVWQRTGWTMLLASAASIAGLAMFSLRERDAAPNLVRVVEQPAVGMSEPPIVPAAPIPTKNIVPPAIAKVKPAQNAVDKAEDYYVFTALETFAVQIGESKEFDEVSESLQPIRSSFGLAIDALRRTLPRGKETRAKPDAGAQWSPDLRLIG